MPDSFQTTLNKHKLQLLRNATNILQVNTGPLCNLTCKHCHVEAGPQRKEVIKRQTMEDIVAFAKKHRFSIADITGGAPELVPGIDYLINHLDPLVDNLIFRSNLTLLWRKKYEPLLNLLKQKKVAITASFPSTNKNQANSQRGEDVWEKSIEALKKLNLEGYGIPGSGLELNLVANPTGAFLPVDQCRAEKKFKADLARKWDIYFTNLYTFANIPLGRFKSWLIASGNYQNYMEKLSGNFNPATVDDLMCRSLISVSWDGYLFDCDFNLAAKIYHRGRKIHVSEVDTIEERSQIITDDHCYGCTAGAGFT